MSDRRFELYEAQMPQIHTKAFVISLQALLVGKKASGIPHSPWDILNNGNTHHHPVAICSRSQRNRFLSVQGVNAIQYHLWSKGGRLILAGNYMKTLASRLRAETMAIGWRYYGVIKSTLQHNNHINNKILIFIKFSLKLWQSTVTYSSPAFNALSGVPSKKKNSDIAHNKMH